MLKCIKPGAAEAVPLGVISHERSGTHLFMDFIRLNFKGCLSMKWPGASHSRTYWMIPEEEHRQHAYRLLPLWATRHPIIKTHLPLSELHVESPYLWHPDFVKLVRWLNTAGQYVYIHRDPRPVMVSYHHFLRGFDASVPEKFDEFLAMNRLGTTPIKRWAEHVADAFSREDVLKVAYESLIKDPETVAGRVGDHLGLSRSRRSVVFPPKVTNFHLSRLSRASYRPKSTAIVARTQPSMTWNQLFGEHENRLLQREAGEVLDRLEIRL